jgi:hypothetical protein
MSQSSAHLARASETPIHPLRTSSPGVMATSSADADEVDHVVARAPSTQSGMLFAGSTTAQAENMTTGSRQYPSTDPHR